MSTIDHLPRRHASNNAPHLAIMCVSALCAISSLLGCGTGPMAAPVDTVNLSLGGTIYGGQQPVSNGNVALYATSSSGYDAAPSLLATATSSASGTWSITTPYTCPAGEQAYIVATGGNPGLSGTVDNGAIFLVAALGPCENVGPSTFVNIDEVTTVAAAYALSGFTQPGGAGFAENNIVAGFSTSPTNRQGLKDAFANAANIVDSSHGAARSVPNSTSQGVVPQAVINSLADILQDCVNSASASSPGCISLFSAATPPTGSGIAAPVNVFQAALDIARYPGNNSGDLFNLISVRAAFEPTLTSMPSDWTIAVTYSGGQLAGPSGLAIDENDNVWVSGSTYASLVEFSPQGEVLSPVGATPTTQAGWIPSVVSASHSIRNLAFDTAGQLWLADALAPEVYQYIPGGTATEPTAGTLAALSYSSANSFLAPDYDLGIDGNGNVWLGTYVKKNCANTSGNLCAFVELQKNGSTYTPVGTFNGTTYTLVGGPKTMAVDANSSSAGYGNVWIAPNSGNVVQLFQSPYTSGPLSVTLPYTGTAPSPQCMAIDGSGNAWIAGFSAGLLYQVSPAGTVLQTITNLTELQQPNFAAFDGNGNLFFANFLTSTVAMYSPGFNSGAGAFLSPSTGFNPGATYNSGTGKYTGGLLSGAQALSVDRSGALWVLNQTSSSIVQILGVGAPARPVLAAGNYGDKP